MTSDMKMKGTKKEIKQQRFSTMQNIPLGMSNWFFVTNVFRLSGVSCHSVLICPVLEFMRCKSYSILFHIKLCHIKYLKRNRNELLNLKCVLTTFCWLFRFAVCFAFLLFFYISWNKSMWLKGTMVNSEQDFIL